MWECNSASVEPWLRYHTCSIYCSAKLSVFIFHFHFLFFYIRFNVFMFVVFHRGQPPAWQTKVVDHGLGPVKAGQTRLCVPVCVNTFGVGGIYICMCVPLPSPRKAYIYICTHEAFPLLMWRPLPSVHYSLKIRTTS